MSVGQTWKPAASLLQNRVEGQAVVLHDGRVLLIGGRDPSKPILECELYDPLKDTWTRTGSLNEGRYRFETQLLPDGRVIVAGGLNSYDGSGSTTSSCEVYNPQFGTWSRLDPMTYPREIFASVILPDSSIVFHAGLDAGTRSFLAQSDHYTSSLAKTGSLPDIVTPHYAMNLYYSTAFRGLISRGGQLGGGSGPSLNEVELWRLGSDHWEFGPSSIDPHSTPSKSATQLSDESILVPSGRLGSGTVTPKVELFDCASLTWRELDDLQPAHDLSVVVTLENDTTVVIGGSGDPGRYARVLDDCTFIDPRSGRNWAGPHMISPRYRHTAAVLHVPLNGSSCVHEEKILVIGGYDDKGNALNSCEILSLGLRNNPPTIEVLPNELDLSANVGCTNAEQLFEVRTNACDEVTLDSVSSPSSNFNFQTSGTYPRVLKSDSTIPISLFSVQASDSLPKVLKLWFHSAAGRYVRYVHIDHANRNRNPIGWLYRQPTGVAKGKVGQNVPFIMQMVLSSQLNLDSLLTASTAFSFDVACDSTRLQIYSYSPPAGWITQSEQIGNGILSVRLSKSSLTTRTVPNLGTVIFTVLPGIKTRTALVLADFSLYLSTKKISFCIGDAEGGDWVILLDSLTSAVKPVSSGFALSEVYPNPAGSEVRLVLETLNQIGIRLSLTDVLGRDVGGIESLQRLHSGRNLLRLSTEAIPSGIYLLRLEGPEKVITRQLRILH